MKSLIIRLLFWLLGVRDKTDKLIIIDDIKLLRGEKDYQLVFREVKKRYVEAKAKAFVIPDFIEWLYYQVQVKSRSCVLAPNQEQANHRRAEIVYLMWMINELNEAYKSKKLDIKKS